MNTSTLRKNLQIKDEINNNKNIETQNINKNEKTSQRNIKKKLKLITMKYPAQIVLKIIVIL